jgi:hypothetical protein
MQDEGTLVALSLKAQTWHVHRFGRYSKYCDDMVCVQHEKGASEEDERHEDRISHMIYRNGIR